MGWSIQTDKIKQDQTKIKNRSRNEILKVSDEAGQTLDLGEARRTGGDGEVDRKVDREVRGVDRRAEGVYREIRGVDREIGGVDREVGEEYIKAGSVERKVGGLDSLVVDIDRKVGGGDRDGLVEEIKMSGRSR